MARKPTQDWFSFTSPDGAYRIRVERYGPSQYRAVAVLGKGSARTRSYGSIRGSVSEAEGDAKLLLFQSEQQGLINHASEKTGPPTTWTELGARFLEDKVFGGKGTARSYRSQISMIEKRLGDPLLRQLKGKDIVALIRQLKKEGKAGATIQSLLRCGKVIFKWGEGQGLVVEGQSKIWTHKVAVDRGLRPYLKKQEIKAFLEACNPDFRPYAVMAIYAGLRKGEVIALRWEHLDRLAGHISLYAVKGFSLKSHQGRVIPMVGPVQELVATLPRSSAFVLPNQQGQGRKSDTSWLTKCTHDACRKAGVTDVDFHGLRRTFGTLLIQKGVPLLHVSKLLGHSSVLVTERHYIDLIPQTLTDQLAGLSWDD